MKYHIEALEAGNRPCYCLVSEDEAGIATVADFYVTDVPDPAKLLRILPVEEPMPESKLVGREPPRTFWQRFWGQQQT